MSYPFERQLGATGITLPAIGLGCMNLSSGVYGDADPVEAKKVLTRATELGIRLFDTADLYGIQFTKDTAAGFGTNEEMLGDFFEGFPAKNKVFLATKFGFRVAEGGQKSVSGTPDYVIKAATDSERRLHLGRPIDLYYQHRVDQNTPIEETVRAMAQLVKEGKVRYIGLSEVSAKNLRKAHAIHPITAVQMEYSPWSLDIETNGVLDTCKELGISIIAYSPLGSGIMTGKYKSPDDFADDDVRKSFPRFQKDVFSKNLEIVDKFNAFAQKKGCTSGQACIAWILAQGPEFFVIPGTKRVKYLEENWAAKDVVLTPEEVAEIRKVVDSAQIVGDRYPPFAAALLDR